MAGLTDAQIRWLAHELVLQALDEIFVTEHDSQTRRLLVGAWSWAPDVDKATLETYVPKLRRTIEGLAGAISERRARMVEKGMAEQIGAGGS